MKKKINIAATYYINVMIEDHHLLIRSTPLTPAYVYIPGATINNRLSEPYTIFSLFT